ncbi:MAG TPA: glycosyltransferase [Solirubrobacteraceae bacterium]
MSRAVVFPLALERGHLGKDLLLIPEALGATLHCPAAAAGVDWPVPVVAGESAAWTQPEYWRAQRLDGAIVFSFLQHSAIIGALHDAGVRVVAKADTTGHPIARDHPGPRLVSALHDQDRLSRRAAAVASWAARIGPLHRAELAELVRVVGTADHTTIETEPALRAVRASLQKRGHGALAARLSVVPNPVAETFLRAPLDAPRERIVVAVGRWQLRVKGADLLIAALERFLAARPDYRAIVIGDGIPDRRDDRLRIAGRMPQEEIAHTLARARTVITTSRWESFSLACHEGLATGCSVTGPPVNPVLDVTARGPFGTAAADRRVASVAAALSTEAAAWDAGARDPQAIAAFWRERLSPRDVAARFAALLS